MSESSPIRVLHLGSPTGLYGAERWILALVRHLPQPQVESVVGAIKDAPGGEPALCEHAARLGVRTQVFESHGKLSFSAVGQLRRFLRENGIDVLHTHGYKMDIIGALAVRGTRTRILSTPHGWSRNAGMKLRIYETLDRLAFYFLDAVAPLSSDIDTGLRRLPGLAGKLHLIPNGVDLSEVDAVAAPSAELLDFKGHGDFLIGYIGQLIPRKGLHTLIKAFEALGLAQARLCLVGEGPQRAELEALAARGASRDRIHFFGYREDRLAMLKAFDAFVLPSRLEGIPRCVLEAMAAGIAVVATDIPGSRDVVQDDVTGRLVPLDDPVALAGALRGLWRDPGLRARLARGGHDRVRKDYSAQVMAARYTQLYLTLAVAKSGAAVRPALNAKGEG